MILVDIYIPGLDRSYDCYLDENMEIGILTGQIAELICQKEQIPLKGEERGLTLWKPDGQLRLLGDRTLKETGVQAGDRLFLV